MDSFDAESSTKASAKHGRMLDGCIVTGGVDCDLGVYKIRESLQVSVGEDPPFDFWRMVYEGVVAGGTADVVVEATLYPIDTIKTRLQARLNPDVLNQSFCLPVLQLSHCTNFECKLVVGRL
ncbi:hypothetical protein NL676_026440 [Syzygium grande]|nr:hypothetical protein NL676_026440 [Syzygium grande]